MIRYLDKTEYKCTIPLWNEAFPKDSPSFVEYYYNTKIENSRILVKEDENGRILTMLHRNPYRVKVRGAVWNLDYIVGVATAEDARHQGNMRKVLNRTLRDMYDEGVPFTYLMPADEAIYTPFGFTFIFTQPVWEPVEESLLSLKKEPVQEKIYEETAQWINDWLSERYEVFALRDKAYMDVLLKELSSEKGSMAVLRDEKGNIQAAEAFWGSQNAVRRFFYGGKESMVRLIKKRRAIMARITNLETMVRPITVNEDCPCQTMTVFLKIKDQQIPENTGLWKWHLGTENSSLTRADGLQTEIEEENCFTSTEIWELSIPEITAWLFGAKSAEEVSGGENPPFWTEYIKVLNGVFLDEVV